MTAAHVCLCHRPQYAPCDSAITLAVAFESRPAGVFWSGVKICGPLRLMGRCRYSPSMAEPLTTRNRTGAGVVLEIVPEPFERSPSGGGGAVRIAIPQRWLLDSGAEALRALADAGLELAADPRADALVIRYLRLSAAELRGGADA